MTIQSPYGVSQWVTKYTPRTSLQLQLHGSWVRVTGPLSYHMELRCGRVRRHVDSPPAMDICHIYTLGVSSDISHGRIKEAMDTNLLEAADSSETAHTLAA